MYFEKPISNICSVRAPDSWTGEQTRKLKSSVATALSRLFWHGSISILLLPSRAHLSLSEPQLSLSSIPTRTSWRYSLETSTLALRSDLASDLHVILSHRHTNSRRHLRVLCECMCVSQCGWNQNPQVSRGISGEWGFVAYTQFPLNHAHSSFHNVHLQITLSSSGWG